MTKWIAIVSAPQHMAHPMVAAEALKRAAAALGQPLAIETRCLQGTQGALSPAELEAAREVIIAADHPVDETPFANKTIHRVGLDEVIADAHGILMRSGAGPHESEAPPAASPEAPGPALHIVAVTSCPTGIAHTFMAAEALARGAQTLGHTLHVETQGSVGAQNRLTPAQIEAADLVLIAADTQVDKSRFVGKRLYETGTKSAIGKGAALIEEALAMACPFHPDKDGAGMDATLERSAQGEGAASPAIGLAARVLAAKPRQGVQVAGPYRHLMTGVSFMLPFVVAGGLLIAMSFALGGVYAFDDAHRGTLAWALYQIGAKSAFALIVPALSGYIAYSIADRPGLAPGMVGGMLAASLGAGFLGGIIAGFLAGYSALLINRQLTLPRNLEGLKPVLIIPLLATLVVGVLMIYVVGTPVASVLRALEAWLRSMQTSSAIVLGALLGAMMASDLGGPLNKAAYAFSAGLIASEVYTPMAATMAAGMTPPLGIALATWMFRNRFLLEEREAGKAAAVLGIAFITEGAIPFAARDPLRIIPACMIGSALAGAISMAAGAGLRVPHGGVFVLPIPNAVSHVGAYIGAVLAGTVVTALAVGLLKRRAAAVS